MTTTLKCSFAIFALLCAASPAYAGPCAPSIARVQAKIDAAIEKRAGADGWKHESVDATRNYQPTPWSLAATEGQRGQKSPGSAGFTRPRTRRRQRRQRRRLPAGTRRRESHRTVAPALIVQPDSRTCVPRIPELRTNLFSMTANVTRSAIHARTALIEKPGSAAARLTQDRLDDPVCVTGNGHRIAGS